MLFNYQFFYMRKINGDYATGYLNKILYFPQCLINSFNGDKRNLVIKKIWLKPIKETYTYGSPSRRLCNMFLNSINWKYLSYKFKNDLRFFDIGCGNGKYGKFFKKISGDCFHSYAGLDIYKDNSFPVEFNHYLDKAENISNYLSNINCIVSISALEHIEYDEQVLYEITKYFNREDKPFIQIHLIPARASLFLYLWHGWRQYSKNNLGKISEILKSHYAVDVVVIPLGGLKSFIRHFIHITIPSLISFFTKKSISYEWDDPESKVSKFIERAVLKELETNDLIPTFWGLIISSKSIDIDSLFTKKI